MEAVRDRMVAGVASFTGRVVGEVSGFFSAFRAIVGRDPVTDESVSGGQRVFEAGMLLLGSRAAIRASLSGLGISDDLASGIRSALSSGAGEYGVELLEEGAAVHRYVPGDVPGRGAIYTYRVDSNGRTIGTLQRGWDPAGNLDHFDVKR